MANMEERLAKAVQIENQTGEDAYDYLMAMSDEEYNEAYGLGNKGLFGNDEYFYGQNIAISENDLSIMKGPGLTYLYQISQIIQNEDLSNVNEIDLNIQMGILDKLLHDVIVILNNADLELKNDLERVKQIKDIYLKNEFLKEEVSKDQAIVSSAGHVKQIIEKDIEILKGIKEEYGYAR